MATPILMPSRSRAELVTNRSSPTSWQLVADHLGQRLPAVPVVLCHAVLDRDDGVLGDKLGIIGSHFGAFEHTALACQIIFAILEELGGGRSRGEIDVLAGTVAGLFGSRS